MDIRNASSLRHPLSTVNDTLNIRSATQSVNTLPRPPRDAGVDDGWMAYVFIESDYSDQVCDNTLALVTLTSRDALVRELRVKQQVRITAGNYVSWSRREG